MEYISWLAKGLFRYGTSSLFETLTYLRAYINLSKKSCHIKFPRKYSRSKLLELLFQFARGLPQAKSFEELTRYFSARLLSRGDGRDSKLHWWLLEAIILWKEGYARWILKNQIDSQIWHIYIEYVIFIGIFWRKK